MMAVAVQVGGLGRGGVIRAHLSVVAAFLESVYYYRVVTVCSSILHRKAGSVG